MRIDEFVSACPVPGAVKDDTRGRGWWQDETNASTFITPVPTTETDSIGLGSNSTHSRALDPGARHVPGLKPPG